MSRRPDPRIWDLVVIGGGSAGLVAAHTAAEVGARVMLVERDRTGGECLWTGCVPSKALVGAASHVAALRRDVGYASAAGVTVDGRAVMAHVRSVIAAVAPRDSVESLEAAGVVVRTGSAAFTGPASIGVDGADAVFRRAIIATGSDPYVPDVPGLRAAGPLTTDTVWDLEELPPRLLVIGGGPVGCELGQSFARLGSAVTIVEAAERLLPRHDPRASALVDAALRHDGVDVRTATRLVEVDPDRRLAVPVAGSGIGFDAVLVATGTRARTADLGTAAAGVALARDGAVLVDRRLRTSNPRIYAAGDVTPLPHLTHVASYLAGIAATNAVLGLRLPADDTVVPQVVYTDPEVASVGLPTWSVPGGPAPPVAFLPHTEVDRAVIDGRTDGFTALRTTRLRTRVTGATIVGPRAGESIAEAGLAVRRRAGLAVLSTTMRAYPTYGYGTWDAAVAEVRRMTRRLGGRAVLAGLVRLRRIRGT